MRVVSGVSCASGAGSVDSEVIGSAIAVSCDDVEGLVGEAGNAADSEIRVIEGIDWALLAKSTDAVESAGADAANSSDKVGVGVSTRRRLNR